LARILIAGASVQHGVTARRWRICCARESGPLTGEELFTREISAAALLQFDHQANRMLFSKYVL
jgi:hypothetical protein